MKKSIIYAAVFASLTACATSPDKIQTSYVSTLQYQNFDCQQIANETERVDKRANELQGSLKKAADNDSAQMAVGLLLLWPTLFFLEGGDGPEAAEYARLKGEHEALEKVVIEKKCDPGKMTTTTVPATDSEGQKMENAS